MSKARKCTLKRRGFRPGSCLVKADEKRLPACRVTLKEKDNEIYRLITSIHLSRPENYLSIYQSGCNFSCRKCHSWYFSKVKDGSWHTPRDILKEAMAYEKTVTLKEPKKKATAWHAHDTCRCCGSCIIYGERSDACPGALEPESIMLSPQGFGPARNIVAFTGGDLTCCPEFYMECARLIKSETSLWLLIETNGYGLNPQHLDMLMEAGVDAFWLDIKAFDPAKHQWLTGCGNDRILKLPEEISKRGFTLEVLSLYIPDLIETGELVQIAQALKAVDANTPFTVLAFFPEYKMKAFRSPNVIEMVHAYQKIKSTGLVNIRLGNLGVIVKTKNDTEHLTANVDRNDY